MATSRIADAVGRVLGGRYRLTRPLGTGASAHVFVAEDTTLRRRVAIKVLHPALATDEAFLRRFRAEAQVVASLRHPNILRVYDWGEDDGSPYLVMELLEGGSLRSVLDRGVTLSPGQAAVVGADAARALDHAHRRGLVHRDIKPANLIFDDEGRVTVADFGLARALAEATWTEPAGAVVGTARYAAPELARGAKLDSRADVYSLALVLIEAVTGSVPFASDTTLGTLMARLERDLPVPEAMGPLRPVLESAGLVDTAHRLDAASLAGALDEVASRLPLPAPLPLAGPLQSGLVEQDDLSPTEYPGRPRVFDAEEWEDQPGPEPTATRPPVSVEAAPVAAVPQGRPGPGEGPGVVPPGERPRRFRRVVAVVAALLILAGGGTVAWAGLTGQFTPTHRVPHLEGLQQATAVSQLKRLHLRLTVTGREFNAAAAGTVLSQAPPTGTLREGSQVRVVVSLGPQPVPVPGNLQGDTLEAAKQVLSTLHLGAKVTYATSMTAGAGLVIQSSPDSGTLLPGQSVGLVVSSGKPKVAVPAQTASAATSFASAKAALGAAGLAATDTYDWSDTVPKGQVISFDPPPGTSVDVGSTITVDISKGPNLVAIPDVRHQSVGSASQILNAAGFAISGVTGNPLGTVTGTNPPAGSMAHYGSAVQIITGKGG